MLHITFTKFHSHLNREQDVKRLKNEMGARPAHQETQILFQWDKPINNRFERKLRKFIGRLPYTYFQVSVVVQEADKKEPAYIASFAQGDHSAYEIKQAIQLTQYHANNTFKN